MAKASINLSNGTAVNLEGTAEEIIKLLTVYGGNANMAAPVAPATTAIKQQRTEVIKPIAGKGGTSDEVDLIGIVHQVKSCDVSEAIERTILDINTRIPRVLLPLYITHKYMGDAFGLTSGEITKITTQLGVPVSVSNASNCLSGAAAAYVMGDKVRKNGQAVKYKLSRKGVKFIEELLAA